jgi:hypothetical protein
MPTAMRAASLQKKNIYKSNQKIPIYKSFLKKCICCSRKFCSQKSNGVARARLFSSETISNIASQGQYCGRCRLYFRHNFVWLGGQKVNRMTFHEMKASGLYFVTSNTAFTMKYLELCYLRLLRAKTSPGQEAAVRHLVHFDDKDMFWGRTSFRDHLLHALEGYAVARRKPDEVIEFNVDFPAKQIVKMTNPLLLFPPSSPVDAVAFDGHFGVHRVLLASVEPARQVKLKGRPMKLMYEYERSCQCKKKDAVRQVLPDRTAGWQFALDPMTGKVLGAYEHVVNERNEDKVALLQKVLALPMVSADLLLHDDACHFESFVNSRNCEGFENIKYYMVDCFHMRNHRCSKSVWTRKEKQRVKTVRTNMSESFNAWLRPLNFFLNHVRPHSHKFWVEEAILFHNEHVKSLPTFRPNRSTASSRSKLSK